MEVVTLPIDTLTPYEGNARKHSEYDLAAIVASIEQFGFRDPIGVWGKENLIVEGHGRYLAALELGMETVDCIRLDHLTDAQRKAYALAHNKTAELSGWDFEKLDAELERIKNVDMEPYGFGDMSLDGLDGLFGAQESEKEPKKIQCPECGEWFEI